MGRLRALCICWRATYKMARSQPAATNMADNSHFSVILLQAVSKITKTGVTHGLAETNSILSSACHGGPDGSCSFTTVGHIGVGDIHFTIDQSDLRNWIADVEEVINKDLQNAGTSFFNALLGKNKRDCLPPGYFW